MALCACGCGGEVKEGRKFLRGHNFINIEDRELLKTGKKRCKKCGEIKYLVEFYKRVNRGTYLSYCKICENKILSEWRTENFEYFKKYYKNLDKSEKNKKQRDRRRKAQLTTGGKLYTGLSKRDYPINQKCEICGDNKHLLGYHHWDDNDLNKGIWVCHWCDVIGELTDSNIIDKLKETYLTLKLKIEG